MSSVKSTDIIEIAKGIRDDVDFENCEQLLDDKILDSFDVVGIAGELMKEYDIKITVNDIGPENFNSIKLMCDLIERKMKED